MSDIFYFLIITIIAFGIGRMTLRLVVKNTFSSLENFIFSSGIGLGLLGYLVYIIGSFGFLHRGCILGMLFVCLIASIYPVYKFISHLRQPKPHETTNIFSGVEKILFATPLFIAVICLFGTIAPETGNDALAYHLFHPKLFIEQHKISHIPFTRESMWPYLVEMLFTLGLLIKGAALAKLFHYFFAILSALAVFSFTRRFFGRKEALLATAFFSSAPGIFMQAAYAYIDLAQCFYSLAAFYALMLWRKERGNKLLILSAIFTGLGLSVKLLSGIAFIILALMIITILLRQKTDTKEIVKSFFIFSFFTFLVCCVWYIRSYIVLGNPVYPFLHNIFGSGWETHIGSDIGTRRDFIGFLRLPWDLVMHLDSFGGEQIGIIFLMLLPFVAWVNFKKETAQYTLIFLLGYAVLWFWIDPNVRFAFVNFALIFILLAVGFYNASKIYRFSILKALLCLMLIFNIALCLYYNRDAINLRLGRLSERDYLLAKERTYAAAEYVNKNLPAQSLLILADEPRAFYFERKTIYYPLWIITSTKPLSGYIAGLSKQAIPAYLLSSGYTVKNTEKIQRLIRHKALLQEIECQTREGQGDKYFLYKL